MQESPRIHSLFIDVEGEDLVHQYMCREGDAIPQLTVFRKRIRMHDLRDQARILADCLVTWGSSATSDTALRERGGALYDKVIPAELAERLKADSSDSYLVLYLDPALVWLPWELLWDGDQFLSRRFRVSRFLQKTAHELHAAEQRLRQRRSGRGALIVFGDTSRLQADAEKAEVEKALDTVYGSNIWFHRSRSAVDILGELKKDYEICHFIGHGKYVPETPSETGWIFADGTVLTCSDVEGISTRAVFPLLIFANSCDSARPSFTDAQGYLSTLYRAFLQQGTPHYIGTLARIPDEPARDFAKSFYHLLAKGLSIGEALGETRRVFAERPGMPIWAHYVHYGDPTYRFVETLSARPLPHDSTPVAAWRDILEHEAAPARPESEPFVDRDKELGEAKKHLKRLADGKPSILFIAGEAGVGKSALLRHLLSEAMGDVAGVATAVGTSNVQLGITDPYLPFKEIFRSLIRNTTPLIQPRNEALTVGELIVAEFAISFPQLVAIFRPDVGLAGQRWEQICQRLGIHEEKAELETGVDQTAIFDQASRLLRHVAATAPLILAVDNLHWADDTSIALFIHLGRTLVDSPVLLVGTYRSDILLRSRAGAEHSLKRAVNELRRCGAHTISLDLSTAKASERERIQTFVGSYLESVLPGHRLAPWFVKRLVEHTGGNALFLKELVGYAQEKGHVISRNGKWELASEMEQFELPESVGGIIEERIAQLSEELRETLTYASVEGEDFTAQVLVNLQQLDEDKVLSRLGEDLNRIHQLVDERGEHELSPDNVLSLFHFRNTFIQQHVYKDLGIAQRRRIHKKVGECLEQLYKEKRMEIAGHLAAHFRIAREWGKAFSYAIDAARNAARVYGNREAIRNYKTALELWELWPERDVGLKATLLLELGDVYKHIASLEEAVVTYKQVLELEVSKNVVRAYALNGIGDVHRVRGDYQEALSWYQECEAIARDLEDEKFLVELWTDLGDLFFRWWEDARARGAKDDARAHRAKALEYAELVLRDAERISAWENVRRNCVTLGSIMLGDLRLAEALALYMRATELAEQHGLAKKALCSVGEVLRLQRKYDEALDYYKQYLDWALKTGAIRHEIVAYANIGLVYLAQQDFEQARDFFDKALELNNPLRYRLVAVVSLAMKGLSFELQDALPAALELYREALKVAEVGATDVDLVEAHGRLGRMLAAYNEPEAAIYFLKKYLEYAPADAEEVKEILNACSFGSEHSSDAIQTRSTS